MILFFIIYICIEQAIIWHFYFQIHLSKDEFDSIFGMAKEEFAHLPEWKQNDLKKRMDLY